MHIFIYNTSKLSKNYVKRLTIALHFIVSILFILSPWFFMPPRHYGEPVGYYHLETMAFVGINIWCVCFFYWNSLVLLPRFLLQEKHKIYWLTLATSLAVFTGILFLLRAKMPSAPPPHVPTHFENNIHLDHSQPPNTPDFAPHFKHPHPHRPPFTKFFLLLLGAWCLSTLLAFAKKWRTLAQKQIETEAQQKTQELAALRAQINPHFLFNTLNNIYSLTQINADAAGDAILQLADFMRYVVQEGDKTAIPLLKEVAYIEHFIALQRLRLNDLTKINLNISGNTDNTHLAPLLLMPFIENAFAYGVSTRLATTILIDIAVENQILNEKLENKPQNEIISSAIPKNNPKKIILKVENAIIKTQHSKGSGVAIANTKRRLELLYPNRHTLTITETAERYVVVCSIEVHGFS
jgi:DNA-binding CsgD family transcriptional regulator